MRSLEAWRLVLGTGHPARPVDHAGSSSECDVTTHLACLPRTSNFDTYSGASVILSSNLHDAMLLSRKNGCERLKACLQKRHI